MEEFSKKHRLLGDIIRAMDKRSLFSSDEEKIAKIDELCDYSESRMQGV